MSKLKKQAVEILEDIPEDKVIIVIEMLKALRALYAQTEESVVDNETIPSALGIFSRYANPDLISLEKEAWSEAVKEKHAAH